MSVEAAPYAVDPLSPLSRRFVLHWGEMGSRWGVNRTVAQVHALLFLSGRPMDAEEIASILVVARSNVSNSLRELINLKLVRVSHKVGERRDHFETSKDVWELFRTVVRERDSGPNIAIKRSRTRVVATEDRPSKVTVLKKKKKFAKKKKKRVRVVADEPESSAVIVRKKRRHGVIVGGETRTTRTTIRGERSSGVNVRAKTGTSVKARTSTEGSAKGGSRGEGSVTTGAGGSRGSRSEGKPSQGKPSTQGGASN